jgi:hypothetical protein
MSAPDGLIELLHRFHLAGPRRQRQELLAAGYRKPRTITTAEEIRQLPALTIVVHDDMATGGPLQTYVVPDDGTVMFKDSEPFHLLTFAGDYVDAEDMPLPLTVVYEVGA